MTPKAAPTRTQDLAVHVCWTLLRRASVGRPAVWDTDRFDVFPINCTVDHGTLVFRTSEGTKVAAALKGHPAAVEADGVDSYTGTA